MVDVISKRCLYDLCTVRPSFNHVGSKSPAFCKQHAEDGMVNVRGNFCLQKSCTKRPTFNVFGSKKPVYCKQHAPTGWKDVRHRRCSHDFCTMFPRWGLPTDGSPSVCARHKSDLTAGPVIDFKATCKVAGCQRESRWGLDGKQPTHCPGHGRLEEGLVHTVGADVRKPKTCSSSYGSLQGSSFHVKAECLF